MDDKFFDVQNAIRTQPDDMQAFFRDMKCWETEMKRKEMETYGESMYEKGDPTSSSTSKSSIPTPSEPNKTDQNKVIEALYHKEQGNNLTKSGKWESAIASYTKALNCNKKDPTFYVNRALCYIKLKRWGEGESDCSEALYLDKSYVKAYYRRALCRKNMRKYDEAKNDVAELLRIEPENKDFINEKRWLDEKLKEMELKKEEQSSQRAKSMAYQEKEKGNALVSKKKWIEAIACYTRAINYYGEETVFYSNRALCYLHTDEPKKAVLDCFTALSIDNKNVKAYLRRALALKAIGRIPDAREDLLKALNLEPENLMLVQELRKIENEAGLPLTISEEDEKVIREKKRKIAVENASTKNALTENTSTKNALTKNASTKTASTENASTKNASTKNASTENAEKMDCNDDNIVKKCSVENKAFSPFDDWFIEQGAVVVSENAECELTHEVNAADRCYVENYTDIKPAAQLQSFKIKLARHAPSKPKSDVSCDYSNDFDTNIIETSGNSDKELNIFDLARQVDAIEIPAQHNYASFERVWSTFSNDQEKFDYLEEIGGPFVMHSLLDECLEPELFSQILKVLSSEIARSDKSLLLRYVENLGNITRLPTMMAFASEEDNNNVRKLLNNLAENDEEQRTSGMIKNLKIKFFGDK